MNRVASLSLDLDDKWSYMKTHGDPGWRDFPSYLEVVVPRVLALLGDLGLKITFFVVGQDAALEKNRRALGAIAAAGHEIGNHSFHHEPWLHRYSERQVEDEIAMAEFHIERATGQLPIGFRGPGFSFSPAVLRVLARRGYQYDASTFPTFLGPLARAYYFATSQLSREELDQRRALYGTLRDGLRPLKPYQWRLDTGPLIEIPVTTLPIFKVPIHISYLLYLSVFSPALALAYFRVALHLCRREGVQPSLLLHPLDFLGRGEAEELSFFPAMNLPTRRKTDLVREALRLLSDQFAVLTLRQHVRQAAQTFLPTAVPTLRPEFLRARPFYEPVHQ